MATTIHEHVSGLDAVNTCRLGDIQARCVEIPVAAYYAQVKDLAIDFGPSFRAIAQLWKGDGEALAKVVLPEPVDAEAIHYVDHPVFLNGFLQVFGATLYSDPCRKTFVPTGIGKFVLREHGLRSGWSYVRLRERVTLTSTSVSADLLIFDDAGNEIGQLEELTLSLVNARVFQGSTTERANRCMYHLEWSSSETMSPSETSPSSGVFVVLSDSPDLCERISAALRQVGYPCVAMVIQPECGGDPATTLSDRHWDHSRVHRFVSEQMTEHLPYTLVCAFVGTEGLNMNGRDAVAVQYGACVSALGCIQTVVNARGNVRVWLLTSGAQSVKHGDAVNPTFSALWGIGRVAARELAPIPIKCIDVDDVSVFGIAATLAAEAEQPNNDEQVAYRHGVRFLAQLTQLPLQELTVAPPANQPQPTYEPSTRSLRFRPDRSYLISGGSGALGRNLTRWMAGQGAKAITLVSRNPPDSAELDLLRNELATSGATVLHVAADISRHDEVDRAMDQIKRSQPPIGGIFHLAAVLDDGILPAQDWQRVERVFLPKVAGVVNLHRASADLDLEYFVCFSSIAGLLGSPGQANYAGANAFLDSFVAYRKSLGMRGTSIAWGPWAGSGMTSRLNDREISRFENSGISLIDHTLGFELLGQVLDRDLGTMMICPIDWPKLLSQFAGSVPSVLATVAQSPTSQPRNDLLERLSSAASEDDRRQLIRDAVSETLAAVLQIGPQGQGVECQVSLRELGIDSLMAVDLRTRLERRCGLSVPVSVLLQEPTLEDIVDMVLAQLSAIGAKGTSTATEAACTEQRRLRFYRRSGSATHRLICFHHMSGGASIFRSWPRHLRPEIDVWAIQLPGREDRIEEPPATDFEELIEHIGAIVRPHLDDGVATSFYGHSMGALIAYTVGKRIQEDTGFRLSSLIVGSAPAPQDDFEYHDRRKVELFEVPQELSVNAAYMREFVPIMEADGAMLETYRWKPPQALPSFPILAFRGDSDPLVSESQIRKWKDVTAGQFKAKVFSGRHMFISDDPETVLRTLDEELHALLAQA